MQKRPAPALTAPLTRRSAETVAGDAALAANPSIGALQLVCCCLSEQGQKDLAAALPAHSSVRALELSSIAATTAGCGAILEALGKNTALQSLRWCADA